MDAWVQLKSFVNDLIVDHWVKVLCTLGVMLAGMLFAHWQHQRNYRRRQFLRRTNLSLNFITENTLRIRTIFELDIAEVLFNKAAENLALKAARRTTLANPFFDLKEADHWFINNSVLNEIAERFVEGQLAATLGQPTITESFVFGCTCEKDGDVRVQKIRVMLIAEKLLQAISAKSLSRPHFEENHHQVRWSTLEKMAEIYNSERKAAKFVRLMPIRITMRDMLGIPRHVVGTELVEKAPAAAQKPVSSSVEAAVTN